uniref:AN1-type domain-containing protein n=1 Tax=Palpitomonas bilix TaxID=652834 RepID=A0A7S3CZH6_9EUKA|mmetsp:Transcript_13489/g.35456  ORF Transcript_13489/g.35456 Transcript_13489/m.35456 type:complete len:268 (+) Transcript_13489:224-1027(+)
MELPELEHQCALAECRATDFLPLKCDTCGLLFCKEHALKHGCSTAVGGTYKAESDEKAIRGEGPPKKRCFMVGCKHKDYLTRCDGCGELYCENHRLDLIHRCIEVKQRAEVEKEHQKKSAKATSSTLSMKSSSIQARKKAMQDKVEMMKRKSKAQKLADDIPDEYKTFVDFTFGTHEKDAEVAQHNLDSMFPVCVCVNKRWTVSKTLALLFEALSKKIGAEKLQAIFNTILPFTAEGDRISLDSSWLKLEKVLGSPSRVVLQAVKAT